MPKDIFCYYGKLFEVIIQLLQILFICDVYRMLYCMLLIAEKILNMISKQQKAVNFFI